MGFVLFRENTPLEEYVFRSSWRLDGRVVERSTRPVLERPFDFLPCLPVDSASGSPPRPFGPGADGI